MSFASDLAVSFAMHCDMNNLSYEEGLDLAENIADELESVSTDRLQIPGIRRGRRRVAEREGQG